MSFLKIAIYSAIISFVTGAEQPSTLNVKTWQSAGKYPNESDFPEVELLKDRPNTAIGFSGGGSRAFVAAAGYLAGLRDLDLLKNVRYIGGISGGGWATTSFVYAQNSKNDEELLCEIVEPQDIKEDELKQMDQTCMRGLASKPLIMIGLSAYQNGTVDSIPSCWSYGVSKTYLEPLGIEQNVRFSWSQEMVDEIKQRNPLLRDKKFLLPTNPDRPFYLVGASLVGPSAGAPYTITTQNITFLEFTPMYVGQMMRQDVAYKYHSGEEESMVVGGLIETFSFAQQGKSPSVGLPSDETSGILIVPTPDKILDLSFASGATSYAPGVFFAGAPIHEVAEHLAMPFDYWSPAQDSPEAETTLFGDGGSFENVPLISFVQRRVPKIVLFWLSATPLQPSENWDVDSDPYDNSQVNDGLSCYFGALSNETSIFDNRTFSYENNQIFPTEDYSRVIKGLQEAQAQGKGIVATFNLTTIENEWWGVPAGLTFEITISYLGRLSAWEALLSPEMYELVVPSDPADAADLSVTIDEGPFKGFPHYPTIGGSVSYERANLLADLTGWSVLQNEELFRRALS